MLLANGKCPRLLAAAVSLEMNREITYSTLFADPLDPTSMSHRKHQLYSQIEGSQHQRGSTSDFHFQKFRLALRKGFWQQGVAPLTNFSVHSGPFDYAADTPITQHVYLNFADASVFAYWSRDLMAQDEVQSAEHPALARFQDYMSRYFPGSLELDPRGYEVALFRGVQRFAELDLEALYGKSFADASEDLIAASVHSIDPPTVSTILAMPARAVSPELTGKPYTAQDIEYHFLTSLNGFRAARIASQTRELFLHTGNWGGGAFGNHQMLMAALQIMAASTAGVDQVVYHVVDTPIDITKLRKLLGECQQGSLGEAIACLAAKKFRYGRGNGT